MAKVVRNDGVKFAGWIASNVLGLSGKATESHWLPCEPEPLGRRSSPGRTVQDQLWCVIGLPPSIPRACGFPDLEPSPLPA